MQDRELADIAVFPLAGGGTLLISKQTPRRVIGREQPIVGGTVQGHLAMFERQSNSLSYAAAALRSELSEDVDRLGERIDREAARRARILVAEWKRKQVPCKRKGR